MSYAPWDHDAGTFLIYVDSCQNDIFAGRFYHPFRGESGYFSSLTQLLLKIEHSLDLEDEPQSFSAIRRFSPLTGIRSEELDLPLKKGAVGNFSIRIMFRRNASWQGSVTWLEGKQAQSFRSVLELITLMNSAIAANRMTLGRKPEKTLHYAE